MKQSELLSQWLAEEEAAQIHGWDFSHIHGRYEEGQDLPWDFDQLVRRFLLPEHRILDMDTGGGEFLLSLGHPQRAILPTRPSAGKRSCLWASIFGRRTEAVPSPSPTGALTWCSTATETICQPKSYGS